MSNCVENGILTYYTVSVIKDNVVINKKTTPMSIIKKEKHSEYIASKYLTKQAALDAIEIVLPKARLHFECCELELKALKNKLSFYTGYTYDGDTHGIYNEYSYISFKMDGFDFEFEIKD